MKNYCDICFTCNNTEYCQLCSQSKCCSEFKKCFDHKPYIMWQLMTSFDDIVKCIEKWRLYNEQTIKP